MDGWDGMVIIGPRQSKSTFGGTAAVTINPTLVFTEHQQPDFGNDSTFKYYELEYDL